MIQEKTWVALAQLAVIVFVVVTTVYVLQDESPAPVQVVLKAQDSGAPRPSDAWQDAQNNADKRLALPAKTKDKQLVIYTSYRGGSSFIGAIFQSHPEIYYVFEPFILVFNHMRVSQ